MSRNRVAVVVAAVLLACMLVYPAGQAAQTAGAPDREYVLDATMLGYRGIGGEIEGVRNPTLWARPGETVRITIVTGELMVHDVVLEKLGVKSPQILDKGATTSITFKATQSDIYFCSVPGHRQAGMVGRLEVSDEPRPVPEGAPPAVNGRPLNLDFEKGTLDDWTVAGDAFELVKTGTDGATRFGPAGTYWISSAGRGSARKGSLSSVPFTVTHPYASFLVSGGAFDSTRVELVSAETKSPLYTITGANHPRLRPAVVDLRAYLGKNIFVRLVDDEAGEPTATYIKEDPWAHINFDHFRFHESRPSFVNEIAPADVTTMPPVDPIPHAGLSARDAARAMTVPKGFSVTLAASLAEGHTYPVRAQRGRGETGFSSSRTPTAMDGSTGGRSSSKT